MSETELRELDAWIDLELFDGGKFVGLKKRGLWYCPNASGYTDRVDKAGRFTTDEAKKHEHLHDEPVTIHEFPAKKFTTDPAAAMMVLEKCIPKLGVVIIGNESGYIIAGNDQERTHLTEAKTLPLAICLFAKKIFSK